MTPTLHFALVFGSISTYDAVERIGSEHEGAVGEWHYRASVGPIPERVRRIMAVTPGVLDALLRPLTGQPQATTSQAQDHLAARDDAIDRAAQNYRMGRRSGLVCGGRRMSRACSRGPRTDTS